VSFLGLRHSAPAPGHENDPGFLLVLINIMSCHLFFIYATLSDADSAYLT
jgi:hypothetical protein